jgi:hypothetical protein
MLLLLRLVIAWRLLRFCLTLIVCAGLVVALSSSLRGPGAARLGGRSVAGAISRVQHALEPVLHDARRALTRALPTGQPR